MIISKNKILIKSINFSNKKIYIELNSNKILAVPYTYTERLQKATLDELKCYRFIANGVGIHFPKIDEDISLNGILKDFKINNIKELKNQNVIKKKVS